MTTEYEYAKQAKAPEERAEAMPSASEKFRNCITEEHKQPFNQSLLKFTDNNGKEVSRSTRENKYGQINSATEFYAGELKYEYLQSDSLKKPTIVVFDSDGKEHNFTKAQSKEILPVFQNIEKYFADGKRCQSTSASESNDAQLELENKALDVVMALPPVKEWLKQFNNANGTSKIGGNAVLEVTNHEGDNYTVHVAETFADGRASATFNWYSVNLATGEVKPQF